MSIYKRLFTYRPRPKRLPLEDFLSAAFADLLNRLPREQHVSFVAGVLLKGAAGRAWSLFMAHKPHARLVWVTQRGVRAGQNAGIVDMLLLVDGREHIVVESKVGAAIRGHASTAGSGSGKANIKEDGQEVAVADANQLTTYGTWLAQRCGGHDWPGALVLLTHSSEPPQGYGSADYGVPHVGTCRWREVWKWARDAGAAARFPNHDTWTQLSAEFAAFLETKNMSSDHMTQGDVARAQVFISAAAKIHNTFNTVAKSLHTIKTEIGSGEIPIETYESVGGVMWTWLYLKKPSKAKWYVSWGIRFPESSQFWTTAEPVLPSVPHAFVALGTDNRPIPLADLKRQVVLEGWSQAGDHELVVGRRLSDFSPDPDAFAAEFADWVAASINDLRPTLADLEAAVSKSN